MLDLLMQLIVDELGVIGLITWLFWDRVKSKWGDKHHPADLVAIHQALGRIEGRLSQSQESTASSSEATPKDS